MDQEKFVSKGEVKEYTELFDKVFAEIQKKLKKNNGLTFSYRLVGSAKRRLVIRHHNKGFDCDYQLFLQRNKNSMEPKEIKQLLMDEFDKRFPSYGFSKCQNKTKAIKIKKKITENSKIIFSYDIVIIRNANRTPQIIQESDQNVYVWNDVKDYSTWEEDYAKIKGAHMWDDLCNRYYDKKIQKDNGTNYADRKSFQILHEAVKETLQKFHI